jgi:hypothetical protein
LQFRSGLTGYGWQRMCLQPERAGCGERINTSLFPPIGFITATMHLPMMAAAERDRELIAGFATECPRLRRSQVVSIGWTTAIDQACVLGDRFDVIAVANPARRRQGQYSFVDNRPAAAFFAAWTSQWR